MVFSEEGNITTMNKRTKCRNIYRKYINYIISLTLYAPCSVVKEAPLTKVFIKKKKKGSFDKISYERRVYESEDDSSLSISEKNKIWTIKMDVKKNLSSSL